MKLQKLQNAVEAFDFDIYSDDHIPDLGRALADHQCVVVRQKLTEKRHYDILSSWGSPTKSRIMLAIAFGMLKGLHWNDIRKSLIQVGSLIDPAHRGRMTTVTFQKDRRGRPQGIFTNGKLGWHSDQPAFKESGRCLGLASVEGCRGSQTTVLSTAEPYAHLSQDDFTQANELKIVYGCHRESLDMYGGDLIEDQKRFLRYSSCPIDGLMAPLVAETASGVAGIHFPGPWFDHFEGMDKKESQKFYDHIWDKINQPKYIYTHNWQDGEVIYFDSEITLHARPTDVKDGDTRRLWRCGGYLDKLFPGTGPTNDLEVEGEGNIGWDEFLRRIDEQRKEEYRKERENL